MAVVVYCLISTLALRCSSHSLQANTRYHNGYDRNGCGPCGFRQLATEVHKDWRLESRVESRFLCYSCYAADCNAGLKIKIVVIPLLAIVWMKLKLRTLVILRGNLRHGV